MFLAWRVAAAATLLAACAPERWRIDSKVRFVDEDAHDKAVRDKKQVDEVSFKEPKDTSVFYSQPSGAGRYPVNYQFNPKSMSSEYTSRNIRPSHYSDGIINSLHYCKCVSTPKCNPQPDYSHACGADQYLCCFKRPSNIPVQNSEFFKKVDDERPILIPGKDTVHGAFSPPMSNKLYPFGQLDGGLDIPGAHNAQLESPIGQMGPKRPVLVGPDGPTGQLSLPQRLILVRPDGPSGVIGLDNGRLNKPIRDIGHTTSAMRGVLVRSGSLPGINGAYHQRQMLLESGGQRGVLSGPGDPINTIGLPAYKRKFRTGPVSKGTIGSERQLLVVPGGHIRQIAHIVPPRYFAYKHRLGKETMWRTNPVPRTAPGKTYVKYIDGTNSLHSNATSDGTRSLNSNGRRSLNSDGSSGLIRDSTSCLNSHGTSDRPSDGTSSLNSDGTIALNIDGTSGLHSGGMGSPNTDGTSGIPSDGTSSVNSNYMSISSRPSEGTSVLNSHRKSGLDNDVKSSGSSDGTISLNSDGTRKLNIGGLSSAGTGSLNSDDTSSQPSDIRSGLNIGGTNSMPGDNTSSLNNYSSSSRPSEDKSSLNSDGASGLNSDGTSGLNSDGTSGLNSDGTSGQHTYSTSDRPSDSTIGLDSDGTSRQPSDGTKNLKSDGTSGLNSDGTNARAKVKHNRPASITHGTLIRDEVKQIMGIFIKRIIKVASNSRTANKKAKKGIEIGVIKTSNVKGSTGVLQNKDVMNSTTKGVTSDPRRLPRLAEKRKKGGRRKGVWRLVAKRNATRVVHYTTTTTTTEDPMSDLDTVPMFLILLKMINVGIRLYYMFLA